MTVSDRAHVGKEPWFQAPVDYFIPGRKGPQKHETPVPHVDELDALLTAPKKLMYRGEMTPFYRIGDLARALNRTPVTIRKWQTAGYIPKPSFSTSTKAMGGSRTRLYSYDQIKIARKIALEEGILNDTAKAITHTDFAVRVLQAWQELKEQG
jgi:hypothetical protein